MKRFALLLAALAAATAIAEGRELPPAPGPPHDAWRGVTAAPST